MDKHRNPFEVGQLVETRSFLSGFRGAWFRCKITKIRFKYSEMWISVEYCDFPDGKILPTKPPPCPGQNSRELKSELMVRPYFPNVYRRNELPDTYSFSDVTVVVRDSWKVGDLVDWFYQGCFWSGKVIGTVGDDQVQIELPPPPTGEGMTYDAFYKDLRPSLSWSPDNGWTMPLAMEGEQSCCAWILKLANQGSSTDLVVHVSDDNYFSEPICPLESVSPSEHIAEEPQPLSICVPEEGLKIGWTVETGASVSSLPPEDKVEEASNAPENEEPSKRWKIYDNYLSEPICPLESVSPPEQIAEEPQALRIYAPEEILKIGWTGTSESSLPPKGKVKEASSVPENEEPSNRKKVDDNYLLEPICPSKSVSPPEQIVGEPQAVSISAPEEIPKIGWTGTSESLLPSKDKLEESSSVPEKEESSNRKKVDDNYLSKSNCLSESVSPPEQIAREPQALSISTPEKIPKIGRHMETGASESSLPPKVKVETLSIPENEEPSRRITDEEISFDCIPGDTLKDAIVDIEVLLNRIKFAKHLLESSMHPDSARPSRKYVEVRPK
ncbi:hypothetical protein ACFE04_026082 [Oxalis oulophora]